MLQPKKLLHSKWTAVSPKDKQKHFLVTALLQASAPSRPIEWVHLEAVLSRRVQRLQWRDLNDSSVWIQGWL
jgi:tryptophan-rich hypothetical protein